MKWKVIGPPRFPDKKQVDETIWLQTYCLSWKIRGLRGSLKPRGWCWSPQNPSSRLRPNRVRLTKFLCLLALVRPFFIPFLTFWTGISVTVILCLPYLHIWEKITDSRFAGRGELCFRSQTQVLTHTRFRWFKWDLGFFSEIQIRYCIWNWCCNGLRFLSTSAWDEFWGWICIFEAGVNCGEQHAPNPGL